IDLVDASSVFGLIQAQRDDLEGADIAIAQALQVENKNQLKQEAAIISLTSAAQAAVIKLDKTNAIQLLKELAERDLPKGDPYFTWALPILVRIALWCQAPDLVQLFLADVSNLSRHHSHALLAVNAALQEANKEYSEALSSYSTAVENWK